MRTGDAGRFEDLYGVAFDAVAGYLVARAHRELAQDALARTFEVAWRRLDDVPDEPVPWLLGVARRVLADLRRAEGRHDALVERLSASSHAPGEGGDPGEAAVDRLVAVHALRSLSPAHREALLLVAWDGLSGAQAAAVLGCSRTAFAVRLHRARAELRARLRTRPGLPAGRGHPDVSRVSRTVTTPSREEEPC